MWRLKKDNIGKYTESGSTACWRRGVPRGGKEPDRGGSGIQEEVWGYGVVRGKTKVQGS